ncbi:aspartate aminotransferase family protein [Micromonospora sp. NPDC048935]|uniref:aspartate aminotransferase family protein n=1 Tax=Micromonospora sp. NPDC048935 TaxID=3364262 RepID=UPI003712E902
MNSDVEKFELAEPYLAAWLASLGLDVEYVRSAGNTLYYHDDQGREIPVLDLVGGYGSTILGHNNPDIVAYAKQLLDEGTPIHAQFSRHPYANDLARKINTILWREFATSEPYSAVFSNSGAESIEIAIKHAEMDRGMKIAALAEQIEAGIDQARAAVLAGARVEPAGLPVNDGFDALVAHVRQVNGEQLAAPPVFLAPEGSFHGKLIGSVQFTHNPGYRTPFKSLAAQCRFVPVTDLEALTKVIDNERRVLLGFEVGDGVVRPVEHPMPSVAAFVLEAVQGEAGIRLFDRETARRIQAACAAIDCPIVIDEVQSGMGRTGTFFASAQIGLQGDYYALAKSLGGGVAKAGLTLIRSSRYRRDFELVHSSTFAKDSFSTLIAGRTVDLLEADGGAAYRQATDRGNQLLKMLGRLRDEFPTVIKDARGRGLMVGLEFHDQSESSSEVIREQARAGLLGYLLASYLLREHAIRMFPTASNTNTMRIEPSIHLTDAEIGRVDVALRQLIAVLKDQDGKALSGA